jgi:hypothetical protein
MGAAARLVLEIEVSQRHAAVVPHDEASGVFCVDGPRRREAACILPKTVQSVLNFR